MNAHDENPQIRCPTKTLLLCDFDGTVSTKDTVNRLLREHTASPEWRFYVKGYLRGELGSKQVYEAMAPLMRMTRSDLEDFVIRHAALDPDFPRFIAWAKEQNIDVKIVSDGFDATIQTLFRNHGIHDLEIFANQLMFRDAGRVEIGTPHFNHVCGNCGTCKVGVLRKLRSSYSRIILIGDGESDRHAAKEADAVLALKDLFIFCARQGIPAIRVENFREVLFQLTRRIEAVAFDMDGTLVDSLQSIADSFNHLFRVIGYPPMTVEEVARNTAFSLIDFLSGFLKDGEIAQGIKIYRDYYDTIFLEKTTLMPGVEETLNALNGTVLQGVITNKKGDYARKQADHLGFAHCMTRIIGAEDGFKAKPAPDMFEEFMHSTGTTKQNTIYVGDAPIDIEAASRAGIDAFVVAGPIFSAEELAFLRPRRVLNNMSELTQVLQPLI